MNGEFFHPTGPFYDKEREKYGSNLLTEADKTGYLQEMIEKTIKKYLDFNFDIARDLHARIGKIELQVEQLTKQIEEAEEIIEIRELSIDKLKIEMLELLSDGKTRYFDEIAMKLKVGIENVAEAFKQLQEEGKLSIDENKL